YLYPYTICENINPTNCDAATATINVLAPVIDAVDDSYGPYNGANGGTTASVLNNDLLNGSPVVPSNITLTAGTSPLPGKITMNGNGTINVAAGTPAGTYLYPYTICENINPTNCDAAIAYITVLSPTDTIIDTLCITCIDTICLDDPFGPGSVVTTTLCDGTTSMSGSVADITILANGCIEIEPTNIGRDTICIIQCDAVSGICDTTILIVMIPPTIDTIRDTLLVDSTLTVCVTLENGFNPLTTTYTYCDGSTGTLNGTLGSAVLGTDGCITYTAGSVSGNEDPICVVACDASLGICDTTYINIHVKCLPTVDTIYATSCNPTDTGIVSNTYTAVSGCDSVVTTITTLLLSTSTTVNATSCNPADTGTVVQTLTGLNGCDSVVTTITTLLPSTSTTVNATSCNPA
ncbi:MAG TPA: hypothetical protein PKL59_22620, partial [Nitrospira sp.]|nr:hypothetical protein [Nitrospira sp.]